ncbi:MAG: sulfatase, partial [Bdellovibrionaceae bacterium]|nr:sulfatase [Pseudobdellovibrionaceae bacterium]
MAEFLRRFEKLLGLFFWSLLFYFVARTEFLIWNWAQFKAKPISDLLWAFLVGFRFDISSILMSLGPAISISFWPWTAAQHRKWQITTFWLFAPFALAFSIMNLGDSEFVNFVGRRFTYDAFFIVGEIPGRLGGIFATYWLLFSVNIVIMFLLVYGSWKILSRNRFARWSATPDRREIPFYIVAVLTVIIVAVIGARGGLQRKPMNVVTAHVFAAPVLNNLVLNSTYTFIKSFGVESISREVYFSDRDEMLKYLNGGSEKGATAQSLMDGQRPKKPQ